MSDVLVCGGYDYTIFESAADGDVGKMSILLSRGVDVNSVHPTNGMSALHYAIGRHQFQMSQYLIEKEANFFPDRLGRMPSILARIMECSEEMCDLIDEAEAAQTTGDRVPDLSSNRRL
ncbi:ankyrin repeat domain-containing protein [Rhodopila sp.]|uniref:ankyrin repeat domain-containing protein n=1 Tax=Rhodopila sp. TaxID=2480087 RepID=UPI003D0EA474